VSASSGSLDALNGQVFTGAQLGGLTETSYTTTGSDSDVTVATLAATTTGVPFLGAGSASLSLTITGVDDIGNTLTVLSSNGVTSDTFTLDVIGFTGTSLLVAFEEPSQAVAAQLQGGLDVAVDAEIAVLSPTTFAAGQNLSWSATGTYAGAAPCFARGTRILTERGEIPVEALREGDLVPTLTAPAALRVLWIGHRTVDPARHPRPWDVMPVRVRAGAFGPGLPRRDLILSPDHAVFVAGALIPIRYLLNGATIVQEAAAAVTYFHVELERHAVLQAEGLPAESFLDTGNRGAFANAPGVVMLVPGFARRVWAEQGCAPLLTGGAGVAAARADLLQRAEDLGWRIVHAHGLHVLADGRKLRVRRQQDRWQVAVPAGTAELRLVSRAMVPADLWPDTADGRRLGVAVADLRLGGMAVDPAALGRGWHPAEPGWQWTDGDARLAPAGAAALSFRLMLSEAYWQAPAARGRRGAGTRDQAAAG